MLGRIKTSAISGLDACPVIVEAQVERGKKNFTLIGLGDGAVREARDRVSSAIVHSGFTMPDVVLVNLAPAGIKKEGSSFDLQIAIAILVASRQIKSPALTTAFHGELALDGSIRGVRGAVSYALGDLESGCSEIVIPRQNFHEAGLISEIQTKSASSLAQVARYLATGQEEPAPEPTKVALSIQEPRSLDDVWGQETAKRALLIAAAGGHNVLMVGPPGCGKSMLAERFASLLPELTRQEVFEVVRVHSVAGLPIETYLTGRRPYRAPHHVISDVGLVGGGPNLRPGEISLAHNGVLFLDEFTEYRRFAVETLRAPLENGEVVVSRAKGSVTFPARFQLIAAMNACPCGRLGSERDVCQCSANALQSYRQRISQPILDRIDLHMALRGVPLNLLAKQAEAVPGHLSTANLREGARAARERQLSRQGKLNARLSGKELGAYFKINESALLLIDKAAKQLGLSARSYIRTLRAAASIADLGASDKILAEHVAEALSYRPQMGPIQAGALSDSKFTTVAAR